MKRFSILFALCLGAAALACEDDDGGGTTTSSTTPAPEDQPPSPGGQGGDNDEECPSSPPRDDASCDVSFTINCEYGDVLCNCLGFGDRVWQCQTVSDDGPNQPGGFQSRPEPEAEPAAPPGGGASANPRDCPDELPTDRIECSVSFLTECNYGGASCNCLGGSWSCSEGNDPAPSPEPEPGFGPRPEPDSEPEPAASVDGGAPVVSTDDAGAPAPNPESCPRQEPPDDECDIDNVGFGTRCRYGYRVCTCGGFPEEGVWACHYDLPPNPESCPSEAPLDDVCDIDNVGFGTECRYGAEICTCGGFPEAGEWQCREAVAPPEPEPEPTPDSGSTPEPAADAG